MRRRVNYDSINTAMRKADHARSLVVCDATVTLEKPENLKIKLRGGSRVEFPDLKGGTEAELDASLGRMRAWGKDAAEFETVTTESLGELEADLRRLFTEQRETNKSLVARLDEQKGIAAQALEIARNAGRTKPDLGASAIGQMKNLQGVIARPKLWAPEEGQESMAARAQYIALALPDSHLRMYLDDDAIRYVKLFRETSDTLAYITAAMAARGPAAFMEWKDRGGIKTSYMYAAWESMAKELQGALDTTNNTAWLPTLYTSQLIEDLRANLQIAQTFDMWPMPSNPYKGPVLGSATSSYLQAEALESTAQTLPTFSDWQDLAITLTAYMHEIVTALSTEWDQDSIVPAIPGIRRDQAYALAYGLEKMIVSGQRTLAVALTPLDTGDSPATTDTRYGADGIRYAGSLCGATADASVGGLTVEHFAQVIGLMGKYARATQCVWGGSYMFGARLLVLKDSSGTSLVLTREKAAGDATLWTGVLGSLLGYPVVISDPWPSNMNPSGIVDGITTGYTSAALYNRMLYKVGQRQAPIVQASDQVFFLYNQWVIKTTARMAFSSAVAPDATHQIVGLVRGIANFVAS